MTVHEAIAAADVVLPGHAALDGPIDLRWQAIIRVAEFMDSDPEAVWAFALRWGASEDADLRMAIATCILEHLLERHHDRFIDRIGSAAAASPLFANTMSHCW